jgi:hypothetical protein
VIHWILLVLCAIGVAYCWWSVWHFVNTAEKK